MNNIYTHQLSDMSWLPSPNPSASSLPMNVSVLLYNKLPLQNLLIILAGVLLFLFHSCSSPFFLSSMVFHAAVSKEHQLRQASAGPHAWVTSRYSSK